jgi:NADPH-dependent glutamate synthase beta subunit-like oxidoreductase
MDLVGGKPVPTGEFETLEADSVILALGQDTDSGFLKAVDGMEFKPDGTVSVDDSMMTGRAGIFAGGDMVPGNRTVTISTGHGKRAARNINAWLNKGTFQRPDNNPVVTVDKLQVWYKTIADASKQPHLDPAVAVGGFDEIVAGLTETEARYEAQRCFSCGNCFECDGCYGACPEHAIEKLGAGKRYKFHYELCTGCAVCYEQCPCHAIDMVPEPELTIQ